jgi:hypothetical protein
LIGPLDRTECRKPTRLKVESEFRAKCCGIVPERVAQATQPAHESQFAEFGHVVVDYGVVLHLFEYDIFENRFHKLDCDPDELETLRSAPAS